MTFRTKMIASYLACGIIPLLIATFSIYFASSRGLNNLQGHVDKGMTSTAEAKLRAQHSLKRAHVEAYFAQIRDQVITFAEDGMVVDAVKAFRESFDDYQQQANFSEQDLDRFQQQLHDYYKNDFRSNYVNQNPNTTLDVKQLYGALDQESLVLQNAYISGNQQPLGSKHLLDAADNDTEYDQLHRKVHPVIRDYLEKFGYYDIFLVDPTTGDIVYSVFKELDYSTSLLDGPYAGTNFGECFRRARELAQGEYAIVDFEQYTPSYETPASFIASPIYDGETLVGVAMFQMPVDRIISIFSNVEGLGDTGETVVVGPKFRMRSNSRLEPEKHNLVQSFRDPAAGSIRTLDAEKALAGNSGVTTLVDYRGVETICVYGPINFLGLTWAMLAKIDTAEIGSAISQTASDAKRNILLLTLASVLGGGLISVVLGCAIARWFTKALLDVEEIAESVADASRLMANATADLSDGAKTQADNLKHTASQLEEITATIQRNADNAQRANMESQGSRNVAEKGGTITQQAVGGMGEINDSSRKIADITSTIDEIAFRTNLLALNASVEAARAGEQGKGFAVVASEVRSLAQRSSRAASEIKDLIESSVHKVEMGTMLVTQSGSTLQDVVTCVVHVSDIVSEIAVASRQQASSIEQVNTAVATMDRAVQENASQAVSLSSTAQTLASQAKLLQGVVERFDLNRKSKDADSPEHDSEPTEANDFADEQVELTLA